MTSTVFNSMTSAAATGAAPAVLDASTRSLQAIAAEVGDYSRRLFEDGTSTMGQLAHAKSVPDAFGVIGAFHKRTGEEYVQAMSRIASMYTEAARQQTLAFQSLMAPMSLTSFGFSRR